MTTSTIKFYKVGWRDRNTYVDDLSTYLATLTPKQIDNFIYTKNAMTLSIKLDESQYSVDTFDYNYCDVLCNSQHYYYYIDNIEWVSEHCIRILMSLDTINTLGQDSKYSPYGFNFKTRITRMHKDRFNSKVITSYPTTLRRKIDKYAEEYSPLLWKKENDLVFDDERMHPNEQDNNEWFLIYHSDATDAASPVKISLAIYGDENAPTACEIDSVGQIHMNNKKYWVGDPETPTNFSTDDIVKFDTVGDIVTVDNIFNLKIGADLKVKNTIQGRGELKGTLGRVYFDCSNPRGPSGVQDVRNYKNTIWLGLVAEGTIWYIPVTKKAFKKIKINPNDYSIEYTQPSDVFSLGFYRPNNVTLSKGTTCKYDNNWDFTSPTTITGTATPGWQFLRTIDEIDKTDIKIIKIIRLPYAPLQIRWDSDNEWYVLDINESLWKYVNDSTQLDYRCLRYIGSNSIINDILKVNNLFELDLSDDLNYILNTQPTKNDTFRNINLESKLKNSQFKTNKVVYDNIAKTIELERAVSESTEDTKLGIDYKVSKEVTSSIGFKLNLDDIDYQQKEDYEEYLINNRSSLEIPIYNSSYMDFIKNGYNWQVKQDELQVSQARTNIIVNTLDSASRGFIGGNNDSAAFGAISGVTKATIALDQMQQQQALALQSKLGQLANQQVSVLNNNDSDLFKWYSGNRLHYMTYVPDEEFKNMMYNYLREYGYACNEMAGANLANKLNSRIWFNHIQCSPVFNYDGTNKAKQELVNDLVNRYLEGVTIYHHNTIDGNLTYDFDKIYENYESFLWN